MKVTERQPALIPTALTRILQVPAGKPVRMPQSGKIVMRVKPTRFLLNSSVVGDVINRGDVFIVDLAKGTVYAIPGETPVAPIASELNWSDL